MIIVLELSVLYSLISSFLDTKPRTTAMLAYTINPDRTIQNENGIYSRCDVTRTLSEDGDLYMELFPNKSIVCKRESDNKTVMIDINSLGFRDNEFLENKSNNTIRIIAMGDSFTYGWQVNLSDSYPKQLEALLNKQDQTKQYEVLNLGIPGYDIWNVANLFVKRAYRFSPDMVIISFIDNDVIPENQSNPAECNTNDQNQTECRIVFQEKLFFSLLNNNTHIAEYTGKSFSLIRSKYSGKILLLMWPLGIGGFNPDERYEKIVEQEAKSFGIEVCKLNDIYKKYGKDTLVIPVDEHPNEFAYSLIANELLSCMNKSFD